MIKEKVTSRLMPKPFIPHPAIRGGHAQTIAAFLLPRRTRLLQGRSEDRVFEVAPGIRLLGRCSWQANRASVPTLLLVHGLEGSAESAYMLGTAERTLAARFNVIRLNLRNCGGSAGLTSSLYHAGLTLDLRAIIDELSTRDRLRELYIAGFSLGGNMALKLAGEYGDGAPVELRGVIAVSPCIDLPSCAEAIEARSNAIYRLMFVLSLRKSMRQKARLFPERYDEAGLRGVWSIRKFDATYTAPHSGFRDVMDYYRRASALPYLKHIGLPTLIIHSQDDPLIPFTPFTSADIAGNANLCLLTPERGGHVGFVSSRTAGEDRFWAEARIVDFIRMMRAS